MQKITSPMVAIGALLSVSIFAPNSVCAQQASMQKSAGLSHTSQTTGSCYQASASADAARAQQEYSQAYPYPAPAPQATPAAAAQNYQAQQTAPAEQQGSPSQQDLAQRGYPAQQGTPEQNYTTQERTYAQGAESPAYQAAESPYEAQERALQQSKMLDQVDAGQSKIDTPAAEAMMQQQSQSSNMHGKVAKTGISSGLRTAGRIVGRTALVALPVTAIVLLSRSAATSAMPMMAPSMGMGMMPRMGFGGVPGMGFGMPGMGMGMPNLMNGLR
jgi:fermentation-respiration switch protein FrsA (DUF1100 family)